MSSFNEIITYLRGFNDASIILRLAMALLLGGLIGMERERRRRPAGYRTHMLVCLGATLTMLISQHLLQKGLALDATRLGAQVISGIGFLGAGTIIVTGRHKVKGLTTAAGLWASACMGLAIGIGFYEGALLTCFIILMTETMLMGIDRRLRSTARTMDLYIEFSQSDDIRQVLSVLKEMGVRIVDVEIGKVRNDPSGHPNALVLINMRRKMPHASIITALAAIEGVCSVEEQ
ncbi:MAG: MgtC/SapB family protein [Clostridia bacterium]|nr:MgtC/SapB family protein [Clostridia bacterium]